MHVHRILTAAGATAAMLCAGVATTSPSASANGRHPDDATVKVAVSGLTANRGVNPGYHGNVIFGDGAADGTGALKEYDTHGRGKGTVRTITKLPGAPTDVSKGPHGSYWVLFGGSPPDPNAPPVTGPIRTLYNFSPRHGGTLTKVADLGAYAVAHPDPYDQENNPGDSNPYGLASLRDGSVLVADAGANAIRRVWKSGRIQTVAQLPVHTVSTAHVGDPNLPPTLVAESVPTSIAVGPDGAWYVGELTGFPFTPGASRIWRIKAGTHGAYCRATVRKSACTRYKSGFTSIMDITFDHKTLYVLELAKDGVLAVEGGDPNAPPPPGVLPR